MKNAGKQNKTELEWIDKGNAKEEYKGKENGSKIMTWWQKVLSLTLKMTTAKVVETSVTVNNNSPIQDYVHPDDQTQPTLESDVLMWLWPRTINILISDAKIQPVT